MFPALWFWGLGFLVFESCEFTVDGDKRGFSETCQHGASDGRKWEIGDLMLASMYGRSSSNSVPQVGEAMVTFEFGITDLINKSLAKSPAAGGIV